MVLVQFTDKKFDAGAKAHFQDLFFSTGKIATGSVTEYYKEVSNGLISLTGEVLGPYQLRNPSTYYANGNHGYGSAFPNSRTMADEALSAADPNINLRSYDNDGNGYVGRYLWQYARLTDNFRRWTALLSSMLAQVGNKLGIRTISGVSNGFSLTREQLTVRMCLS